MIPRRTILKGTKLVCEGIIGGDGALSDAVYTIHFHGAILPDTMPMDRSAVISQFICDMDSDEITPTSFDPWTGVSLVEDLSIRVINTVAVDGLVVNLKPILQTSISNLSQVLTMLVTAYLSKHSRRIHSLIVSMNTEIMSI
jgi:hypothetical protein